MLLFDFCKSIQEVIEKQNKTNSMVSLSSTNQHFITELKKISEDEKIDDMLKMTRATVLFEGFYRHLFDSSLKTSLAFVRANRWVAHYGTPTVPFLLSYKLEVAKTEKLFKELAVSILSESDTPPWMFGRISGFVNDADNEIIVDPKSISVIPAPTPEELMGIFIKTHNSLGGFTIAPCDPVSQKFIEHAVVVGATGGKVLEIGAGFGTATLEVLSKGGIVFCNDMDVDNLAVVHQRYMQTKAETVTGDTGGLVLIPGALPDELMGLPEGYFDAILVCRVLHFFPGLKIEESLDKLAKLLTIRGKIYIVCETPFLKNWQKFLPEFQKRVELGVEWPGEISEPAKYESSGRVSSLPNFVNWITKEVLERSLLRAGLTIQHSDYIDRKGQFPEDLLLPEHGKESVGAIAIRT